MEMFNDIEVRCNKRGLRYLCIMKYIFMMVTGGSSQHAYLDSTEIFSDNTWRTVAGKLHEGLARFSEAIINNRVLNFGE